MRHLGPAAARRARLAPSGRTSKKLTVILLVGAAKLAGRLAVRLTSAGIVDLLTPRAGHNGIASMSLLTTPIESTRQTRSNFGLVALTLLGILAIALALCLPDSITP